MTNLVRSFLASESEVDVCEIVTRIDVFHYLSVRACVEIAVGCVW